MQSMIQNYSLEVLLKHRIDDRRRVLGFLQASISGDDEVSPNGDQVSPAAKWLLSLAGRYSGGSGRTANRADEILRAELGKRPQQTN